MPRALLFLAALAAVVAGVMVSPRGTGASPPRAIDPAALALPPPALPPATTITHSAVSDNADADGTPAADGTTSDIHQLHRTSYAKLGRLTGYRMKFSFPLQGSSVTVTYQASIFSTDAQAQAAFADATDANSTIGLIGTPISPACTVGLTCAAYYGQNGSSTIVYTAFVEGPVLIEDASASDASKFAAMKPALVPILYAQLAAADVEIKAQLGASNPTAIPTATPGPQPTTIPAISGKLGSYYLALGDSFAYGYQLESIPADPQCHAADASGFVCRFYRFLRLSNPALQLNNIAQPGADSCDMSGMGHRCYETTSQPSQVDQAVAFIQAHPGQVSPITVTTGGNDLLALLPDALKDLNGTLAKLGPVRTRFRSNLDTILSKLRAGAPDAEIIVTTQPNPVAGAPEPPAPAGFPEAAANALDGMNAIVKAESPKYGAIVADPAAAWDAYPGKGYKLSYLSQYLPQGKYEIHPTPLGYQVYADAVIQASGFTAPALRVNIHLSANGPHRGKKEKVTGTTLGGSGLAVTFRNPRSSSQTIHTTAGLTGAFSATFGVGHTRGTGHVKVCATDITGRSACSKSRSYKVK